MFIGRERKKDKKKKKIKLSCNIPITIRTTDDKRSASFSEDELFINLVIVISCSSHSL